MKGVFFMEKFTGSTSHSDRATKGKNKGRIMVNLLENHRDEEEIKRLNANRILEGKEPKYDLEKSKENIEIVIPSELSIEGCYEDVFKESIEKFNAKQKRSDRKQSVEKILDKMEHSNIIQDPLQCMVVQVGNAEKNPGKEVLIPLYYDYLMEFQERFSNMKVVSAAIHLDEETPHLQFYYVPVKYKEKCTEEVQKKWRGIDMQPSMTGALEQMGYSNEAKKMVELEDGTVREMKDFKQGALAQFQKDFNGLLDTICKEYGIEIDHYMSGKHVQHQDTKTWEELKKEKDLTEKNEILQKEIKQLQDKKENLETEKIFMEETISSLKSEKNSLESQIKGIKTTIKNWVDKFHELKPKAIKKKFDDLFKQRKMEASIKLCEKEEETISSYLESDDLTSEIPIDSFGNFQRGVNKLEDLLEGEEWERE